MNLLFRINISSSKRWLFSYSDDGSWHGIDIVPKRQFAELERKDPGDFAWQIVIERGANYYARQILQHMEQVNGGNDRLINTITTAVATLQNLEQLSQSGNQLAREVALTIKTLFGLDKPRQFQQNLDDYFGRLKSSGGTAPPSQPTRRRQPIEIFSKEPLQAEKPAPVLEHFPLEEFLSDQELNKLHKIFSFFESSVNEELTPNQLTSALIFFQGIYLFLEKRESVIPCKRAQIFCAWQWFNLAKALYLFAFHNYSNDVIKANIGLILAEAYQALAHLLESPAFTAALHWLAHLNNWDEGEGSKTDATLRERVFRSLFLRGSAQFEAESLKKNDLNKPWRAPGLQDERMDWREVELHPAFKTPNGEAEVMRFIHSFLLPHYDFRTALHLTTLLGAGSKKTKAVDAPQALTGNEFIERILTNPWWMLGGAVLALLSSIGIGLAIASSLQGMATTTEGLVIINIIQVLFLLGLLFVILSRIGGNLVGYLSLPRLAGGVIVGYLALILQDNPGRVSDVIWGETAWAGWLKFLLLFLFVFLIGFLYLHFDIRPVLQNPSLAARRSLFLMSLSVFISALLGVFFIALATSQPFNFDRLYFPGPFGWVDLRQYLAYVPLALFTGLVTQFIFEDKPLTAPVWSPEQPN